MSVPTEHFGSHVIHRLRNEPLGLLEFYLRKGPPEGTPADLANALVKLFKLSDADKAALRQVFASIIDQSIQGFLHALDEATNIENDLRVTYGKDKEPLSNGDGAFERDLQQWHKEFDVDHDEGNLEPPAG